MKTTLGNLIVKGQHPHSGAVNLVPFDGHDKRVFQKPCYSSKIYMNGQLVGERTAYCWACKTDHPCSGMFFTTSNKDGELDGHCVECAKEDGSYDLYMEGA